MLSSAEQQSSHRRVSVTKNKSCNGVSSSSSPSSSSLSSSPSSSSATSSSSSPTSQIQNKSQSTMEEVWKAIDLAALHQHQHRRHQNPHEPTRLRSHLTHNPTSVFQDFLHRPVSQEPPRSRSMASSTNGGTSTATALHGSPLPPPATLLSLKSGAGFEFLDNTDPHLQSRPHLSNVSSLNTPFETIANRSTQYGCLGKKRGQDSGDSSSDRRHKRMIQNRESAARSRARKQAYTNELEFAVAHLQKENERLRRQQEQLRKAAAAQLPKKKTLQRSSTAPF